MPSPRSTSEAPEFFFTTPLDFFATVDRPDALRNLHRLPVRRLQIPVLPPGRRLRIVAVPALLTRGQQLFRIRRDRLAFLLHARDRGFDARRIPEFEGTQFPVESQLHRAINFDDGVRNLGNAVGRVSPQVGERLPEKLSRFVSFLRSAAIKSQQHAHAYAGVFHVFRHLQGREPGLLPRTVFEGLPIERQPFFLATRALDLLVEAALGFVAQPFALEHLSCRNRAA